MGAQRSQRKVRLSPGGEHELEGGRCMIDEPGDALAGHAAGKPVEVVQDQRDLTQIVQLVHQARQHHVNDRRRPDHLRRRRQADRRAGPAKRLDHIGPEHHRVVVALVQRQPRDRLPRRLSLPPLRQQGGLPVTRRTCHQAEPQSPTRPEAAPEAAHAQRPDRAPSAGAVSSRSGPAPSRQPHRPPSPPLGQELLLPGSGTASPIPHCHIAILLAAKQVFNRPKVL